MGVQDRDWYWEAKDRREGLRLLGNRSQRMHPATVATLWIIGVILVLAIAGSVMQWRARAAVENVMRLGQEAALRAQAQGQAEQARRDEVARQEHQQARYQQQEAMRVQDIVQRQRGEDDARRAAGDAVDRKAKAWAKFYRKPSACDDAATMECANAFIRAKRVFEEKFAQGEI